SSSLQGNIVILDHHNQPIYGPEPYVQFNTFSKQYEFNNIDGSLFGDFWKTTTAQIEDTDYLFVRSQSNFLSWQVIGILNQEETLSPLQKNMDYYWLLAVVTLLLSLVVAYFISIYV